MFLVTVAVDGKGNVVPRVSPKWSIDDDDHDVLYPNHWIYPPRDPGHFLDIAIDLWEDDPAEDTAAIVATSSAVGGAVGLVVPVAGIAIAVIGQVAAAIMGADDDDFFGRTTLNWSSQASLEAAPGFYIRSYYGEDHTGDSYDFDLSLEMVAIK